MKNFARYSLFLILFFNLSFSNDNININFSKIDLNELIKISSKILKKDILISDKLDIKVDFVSNKTLNKDELLNILKAILNENNYVLEDFISFYKISRKESKIASKDDILIYELKNSEVENIYKILDEFLKKRSLNGDEKTLIVPNIESNSLIVFSNQKSLNSIKKLIDSLDKESLQVYIEAKIIEVNNELVDKVGVSYGVSAASSSSGGIMALSTKLNGGSFAIDEAIGSLGIDIKNQNLKSGVSLAASLNLLKQKGALDIVSQPSILAINNKESFIYVGEKISMQTSSSLTDGGTSKSDYEREDVGLTLKVKPRISKDNKVALQISALLEAVKLNKVGAGDNPDTLKKEINTTAILNNGESVIIGGLLENKNENIEEKVPLLGDIPILGALFRNSVTLNKKSNLVIIVTPYIVPKDKGVSFIREKLSQLKDIEDIYLQKSLEDIEKKENKKEKVVQKNESKKENNNKKDPMQILIDSTNSSSDDFYNF
ncbi:secretin N-terminal domain-containing protein [Aliarcobacter skirrowii]|uniref:type II secretion system protein GspD n=1 Tax=Aliarcobacter skirrowii TaxID=28200 RepID=UPI00299FC3B0|nr:secretin N-terminal domain-containing protein [Aliarcobacter skirrowii]MDX4068036.1 secretin N-terminal domain-containing protein [Aliarcobacter skirrowii]